VTDERRAKIAAAMTGKRLTDEQKAALKCPPGCGCGKHALRNSGQFRPGSAGFTGGHSEETKAKLASYTGEKGSAYRHGWSQTPTYVSWHAMRSRCRTKSNASYPIYGGRGIAVCERWDSSFEAFLEDMGERPSLDYEIDRRDNDLGYWCGHCAECVRLGRPANCRWLTRAENNARKLDPGGWIKRRAKALAEAAAAGVDTNFMHIDGSACLAPDHCQLMHFRIRKAA
jgi:hypothetical protein